MSQTRLYYNGPIYPMPDDGHVTEDGERVPAMAISGDRILAVGSLREVRAAAGKGAEAVDLAGRAVVPGFIDARGYCRSESPRRRSA